MVTIGMGGVRVKKVVKGQERVIMLSDLSYFLSFLTNLVSLTNEERSSITEIGSGPKLLQLATRKSVWFGTARPPKKAS